MVEDPVDPTREGEQVLGLQLEDEGLAQCVQELPLRRVAPGLGVAHDLRGAGVALGPGHEAVEGLDGHRRLPAKQADRVGVSGRNQRRHAAGSCQQPQEAEERRRRAPPRPGG